MQLHWLFLWLLTLGCLPIRIFVRCDGNSNFYWRARYGGKDVEKVRGVNLGGWFVLEPFINQYLFEQFPEDQIPIDEYHLTQVLGKSQAFRFLRRHWSTFYKFADFVDMKNAGLNHVRIPIGYWAFKLLKGDPYVQGQVFYLDRAIEWARKLGLKVIVDLHGAPGSQNGFDNSGLRDELGWFVGEENYAHTVAVLKVISEKYARPEYAGVVTSIELLNEPMGPKLDPGRLHTFYHNGYQSVRAVNSDLTVTIHDAFYDPPYWNFILGETNNVMVDHHQYQVFSIPELLRTIDEKIGFACGMSYNMQAINGPSIVGEFSGALTDCAQFLNGVGRGARYDRSFESDVFIGTCLNRWDLNTWSLQDRIDTRRYIEAQMDAFERGSGWIFWTWKTDNAVEWDFRRLRRAGLIPSPLTNRQFPNQCNFAD